MIQVEEKEIVKGIDEAYKKAGSNAYFGNGFQAGVDFALNQVNNLPISGVRKSVCGHEWNKLTRIIDRQFKCKCGKILS